MNNLRIDDLQFNGLRIFQDPNLFCFGTDAVLLADFCKIKNGETFVDFCSGNGIIPILLSAKVKNADIIGIEVQSGAVGLFNKSIELNDIGAKVRVLCGDVKDPARLVGKGVDAISVNPPYEKSGSGKQSENDQIKIARHEILLTLEECIKSAGEILKTGGRFYIIHRSSRFCEIIGCMQKYSIEPKVIRLVCSQLGKSAGYVLIEGKKDALAGTVFMPNLYLYEETGEYTRELKKIYHIGEN